MSHRERIQRSLAVKRDMLDEIKNVPCMDCGGSFPPCVMDFAHRERSTKSFGIASNLNNYGKNRLLEEVAKCDILCSNCHRIRDCAERCTGITTRGPRSHRWDVND